MITLSFVVWVVVAVICSWILGNWTIYRIGPPLKYPHLEEKPLAILVGGFLELMILYIALSLLR